jgi:hypothetical protein
VCLCVSGVFVSERKCLSGYDLIWSLHTYMCFMPMCKFLFVFIFLVYIYVSRLSVCAFIWSV